MAEMVIPGTYIEVRAEGLISAGRVSTGIVGIVGTAASGPIGEPVTLASFANAREIFGSSDAYDRPQNGSHPLTLVRALEHLYSNGATNVVAVRVAGASQSQATFALPAEPSGTAALLTARTPGTWANDLRLLVAPAEEDCRIENETQTAGFARLTYPRIIPTPENQLRIVRGVSRRIESPTLVYKRVVSEEVRRAAGNRYVLSQTPIETVPAVNLIRVLDAAGGVVREFRDGSILYGAGGPPSAGELRLNPSTGELTFEATQLPSPEQRVMATSAVGHAAPTAGQVLITTWDGTLEFAAGQAPQATDGDRLIANYVVERSTCVQVSLTHQTTVERYLAPDGRVLADRINQRSQLVAAVADATNGARRPRGGTDAFLGTGSNTPGNNGAEAGRDAYASGLERLANRLINIIVLAGQDADTMGSILLAHLNATEATDLERIGVIGARGTAVADFLGHPMADGRVVVVAPGLALPGNLRLPPAYTAAAVAGLIASLSVQTSLTNKTLNVPGLAVEINRGQQEQLIRRNVLTIVQKDGFRVVKGHTTAGEGTPFSAIPTRRIVDYAKYGVRSAANPYIGRLNNSRVRSALKATLDAFLTRMVEDEALTGYDLEVSATRAQEIAGEVSVVMTLRPTFSIDFIRVVMNLQ